jgi:uncharacterized protein YqhQ
MAEDKHFYGGQAIMEGVMMRGTDSWGAAVQRKDGTVAVITQSIMDLTHRYRWAKWPLVRGNIALVDTLVLGLKSLMFSFNVLVDEQMELDREAEAAAAAAAEAEPAPDGKRKKKAPKKQSDMGWAIWAAMLPSLALGLVLFILGPAALVKLLLHQPSDPVKNLVEGGVRLTVILGYMALIGLLPDIRRLFQYHGAEHATINCYEAGEPITVENCRRFGPLHPRCGTAFLLVFIVVKILVGTVLPYPEVMWQLMALRILMIPVVAALAYEIIRYGGRHRDSLLSRIMAQPGLLMQRLSTRTPSDEQIRIAIYSLATVAPEVPRPAGFPAPVPAAMDGKLRGAADVAEPPAAF